MFPTVRARAAALPVTGRTPRRSVRACDAPPGSQGSKPTSVDSAGESSAEEAPPGETEEEKRARRAAAKAARDGKPKRQAESTDAISSFLTRRFGIAGGLAWLGFLAVGSLGEQVKTRIEVAEVEKGTKDVESAQEVVLPSGVKYVEQRVGGGQTPPKGYLVIVDFVGKANGEVFADTRKQGRPIVFLFGGRPLTGGMCAGTEQVLATMKAGSRRRVFVPASMGFGSEGTRLKAGGMVPPDADLEYDLELVRVSIPPS